MKDYRGAGLETGGTREKLDTVGQETESRTQEGRHNKTRLKRRYLGERAQDTADRAW